VAEAKRQITPGATTATQAQHQQPQKGVQALLGLGQVKNAQQLQGPILHWIKTRALAMGP
jgi:hypothetical protein